MTTSQRSFVAGLIGGVMALCVLALLLGAQAFAQNAGRADSTAINNLGIPLPDPVVRVCTEGATGIPCAPLATIYTDKTAATTTTNPYVGDSFGNFHFYAKPGWYLVQVSAPGLAAYSYKVLLAPDVASMGAVGVTSLTGIDANANAAASAGLVRLKQDQTVCWRNEAGTNDVCLSKNDADQIVGATASVAVASSLATATNPASTGVVRLSQDSAVCWRNEANSADVCLDKSDLDRVRATGGLATASVVSTAASPAQSGFARLGQGEQLCWRNESDTADVCISKNDADEIVGVTATATTAQSVTSATANPADSGTVKLAAADTMCWRNAANTGNICLGKNGSDVTTVPTGIKIGSSPAFTAAPEGSFAGKNTSTFTSAFRVLRTQAPVGITLDGFTVDLTTSPAGCSGFPSMKLQINDVDVTGGSVTLANGTAYYTATPTAANVANAGDTIDVEISGTATGCGTQPASPSYVIWYHTN